MGVVNELFGNAKALPKSLWDMVSYPFGGGTLKQDQAYYAPAFNQFNPNQYGGYGSTTYGPFKNAPVNAATNKANFNNSVVKPVATAVDKAAGTVGGAVANVAENTLASSKVLQYGVIALGVVLVLKILR